MRQSWISPRLWCTAHSGARTEHQIRVLSWRALWWYQALFWLESTGYQSRKISVEMSREEKIWLGATPGQLTLHIKDFCYTLATSLRSRRLFPFFRRWNRASERANERAWGEQKEEEKREGLGRKGILPYPHPLLPIFSHSLAALFPLWTIHLRGQQWCKFIGIKKC